MAGIRVAVVLLALETLLAPMAANLGCCCRGESPARRSGPAGHACCASRSLPASAGETLSRCSCHDGRATNLALAVSEASSPLPRFDLEAALPLAVAFDAGRGLARGHVRIAVRGGAPPPERPPLYLLQAALLI